MANHPSLQIGRFGSIAVATTVTEGGRHLLASWRESRPVVQAMFQLRFLCGAVVAAPEAVATRPGSLLPAAAAWLCATWHVYLLNGLCDQVEDRRNGSRRPLASGLLPRRSARRIAAGLAGAAVLLGAVVSPWFAALVALMLALGWSYSAGPCPQKRNVLGFALVVVSGGMATYLAGAVAAGGAVGPELVVLMVAMSLWMALAGSTKDLSDVDGDRAAGRRTLPVLLGDRRARRLMAGGALAVSAVLVGGAGLLAPALLAPASVLLVGGLAVAGCAVRGTATRDRARLRRPYRVFMISQYTVHMTAASQFLAWSAL